MALSSAQRAALGKPPRKNGPERTHIPIGARYGRLVVVEEIPGRGGWWLCKCDCGNTKKVRYSHLRTGFISSCGCFRLQRLRVAVTTHGRTRSPIYVCWLNMKARCTNPNYVQWCDYGGRGITVCTRWLESFENFLADMGDMPHVDSTIERENVNRGYEPGNCVWLSRTLQNRNKRVSRLITYKDVTLTLVEWSELLGVGYNTLRSRLTEYRWPVEKAFETPKFGGRRK